MRQRTLVIGTVALLAGIRAVEPSWAQDKALTLAYQVTHSLTFDPTFSPDGKRMIYTSVLLGRTQIFAMNLDGSEPAQLTRDGADHEDVAWSPDGRKLAYVLVAGETSIIHQMNPDGSGDEALSPPELKAIHPNWSPDSTRIAFCADDDLHPPRKNPAAIFVLDVATRRLTMPISGGVNTYPAWSPDGKRFAFRRMLGEMNSEVFLANIEGGDERNLSNHPAFDGWPAWSPDGTLIAFASNRNSSYQIFVMKPDGSDVRLVANTEGRATAPRWAPDGKRIYFTNCQKVDFGTDCEILAARLDASPR